ncbi:vitamin B12-dependent ribonucleotide reductase [Acetobacter senegalensis]|uniref:ribonucleoside-diphosphate reductase n=1 Tax=Acetobacter senegalensis TaxID=446692 RepID=A0A0U5EUW2_9PROT|nr:vitamin B12-dependent ribonucleotide reductase [Acetobacter senegalensis]CEF41546.1 vitamin B12-dependent ribonucleotide reductase [Acetobacter senegalensis]
MTRARRHWNGVLMSTLQAAADPDAPFRSVTLPAEWDTDAASALAQLIPGTDAIDLPRAASRWVDALTQDDATARSLIWLLLMRQAAPTEAVWACEFDRPPGFVLNLAAFVSPGEGFAAETFVAALRLLSRVLRDASHTMGNQRNGELPLPDLFAPQSENAQPAVKSSDVDGAGTPPRCAGDILLTNLDACLAGVGLDYDSEDGRAAACAIATLATLTAHSGCGPESLPLPPVRTVLPGLSETLRAVWNEAAVETENPLEAIETGFSTSGPVDGVLGVEACGLAPVFSLLRPDGRLAQSTVNRLEARGFTTETALAAALAGETVLPLPGPTAHMAMYRALTGFIDRMPARPDPAAQPLRRKLERGMRRALPHRHGGFTQKTAIGGHRLFLRTGEYEDGTLGELSLTPTRESAMVKGLMESFGEAVSIGLQYGAPLEEYVNSFAYSCFGPSGTVEGDPVATYATSMLDYAFRALSEAYLGKKLPDGPHQDMQGEPDPLLPLDFPPDESDPAPRKRGSLRLVVS